ncbi:MAG: hypothetical protein ACHP9Y_04120, partial [Gammaproteobacteria bacterium]
AFAANGGTPTAHAYADVASYLMGTTTASPSSTAVSKYYSVYGQTISGPGSGFAYAPASAKNGTNYLAPTSISQQSSYSAAKKLCNGQGIFIMSDGEPNIASQASNLMSNALNPNSFSCAASSGILQNDSTNATYSATQTAGPDSAWNCLGSFAKALYTGSSNPAGVSIRTAFAGLGADFGTTAQATAAKTTITLGGNPYTYYNCANLPYLDGRNSCNLGERAVITDTNSGQTFNTGVGGFGNGGFFLVNTPADIVSGINSFINSLNPVLPPTNTGAPSIPVDTLNPYLQEPYAYYSQFQPNLAQLQGIWQGNLKKYKVANNTYYGKTGGTVISTADGKTLNASTFDYWNSSNTADGGNALAGGAYSQLPVQPTVRNLYTNRTFTAATTGSTAATGVEVTSNNTSLTLVPAAVGTGTGSAAAYAATQDPDRGYLLNLLGYTVSPVPVAVTPATTPPTTKSISLSSPTPAPLRQMGANIHSSPVLLTTTGTLSSDGATYSSRQDYVMYGTTQGLLEVVDALTGVEKFAFVPYEMIVNQENGFLPVTQQTNASQLYAGIDAPWTVYANYQPTGSNTVTASTLNVYGGLRMGGRSYYGLNLGDSTRSSKGVYSGFTNIDTRAPKLLFKIDPSAGRDGAGIQAAVSQMGQSWSKPTITTVNWAGKRRLVMIVGGGYDPCFENPNFQLGVTDAVSPSCSNLTITKGAGVYIFDASTGALLWWTGNSQTSGSTSASIGNANIKYSIVSNIKAVDRDADGLVDALYFGDLGGQVFRIDIDNASSSSTGTAFVVPRIQRIASFNSGSTTKASPRFYEAPSWVFESDPTASPNLFAAVSIASGDRSSPTNVFTAGQGINDGIYTIFDRDIFNINLYKASPSPALSTPITALSQMADISTSPALTTIQSQSGWYHTWSSTLTNSSANNGGMIAKIKGFGPLNALSNTLYVSTYDAAGAGTITACGAGVAGNSYQRNYCLPYGLYGDIGLGLGQCGATNNDTVQMTPVASSGVPLGSGIVYVTVGGTDNSATATTETSGKAASTALGVINANPTINSKTCVGDCGSGDGPANAPTNSNNDQNGTPTHPYKNGLKVTLKRWYEKLPNKSATAVQ